VVNILTKHWNDLVTNQPPIISARNFSKTFSGRPVLQAVDLDVKPGEIHGLLGQNGSGKSTFIKILSGFHHPDEGASLTVRGESVSLPLRPTEARTLGMSFVHQDLGLSASMTVLENLRVGRYQTHFGWRVRWRDERRLVRDALKRFDVPADPDALVSSLGEVERAMVAIVRALEELRGSEGGLLVLDEPTPYLPRDGVDRLFASVRDVAASGLGVLFVTHRLEEVQAITDRVTILRDGALAASTATASLSESDLIELILGFALDELYPAPHDPQGDVVVSARGVSSSSVEDLTLDLRRGEIVGFTGLLGMGWERVPYLLFGADRTASGVLEIGGRRFRLREFRPAKAMARGFALLPANRMRDGGIAIATVTENLTLPTIRRYFIRGLFRRQRELRRVAAVLDEFDVRPPDPGRQFSTLSGGNQQKVLVAKWLERNPRVLLLHEPTQGVDVGARSQIFTRIRDVADEGTAVVLASAEYEDLVHLCDRVVIFRNGRAVSELSGSGLTLERLVEQSFRDDRHAGAAATATAPGDLGGH
jgi:ribose transport system ATP-binding protein